MRGKTVFRSFRHLFVVLVCALIILNSSCNKTTAPRVAILQDKPQDWADALKLGFADGLVELGVDISKDVVLVPRSAAGDPQALTTIAESFSQGADYKLIYSLGTQASQEAFSRVKNKPILFGAVTDPVKAGFFRDSLNQPLGNITGTQDLWPYPAQFDLIQGLIPNIKTIGIVYNSSEINSQVSANYIKSECQKRGIQLEIRTITADSELQTAVSAIISKNIQLFFIPADNTAQAASPTIIALCQQRKIPVFTGISGIVENGALATVGTNYYELGKVNAKQAVEVLFHGKQAKELPVSIAEKGDIYLNLKAAKSLGIEIPEAIVKKAFKMYQ